jgi:ParB-like chromosome segregation protein Spo0J
MPIPASLEALHVPIDSVRPYPGNARRHDLDRLKESLRVNGQYRPIVVNERTQEVLAGNGTWAAARELGWEKIAATFVDADEEQARRIVLVDNRASDLADYDDQMLADLRRGFRPSRAPATSTATCS